MCFLVFMTLPFSWFPMSLSVPQKFLQHSVCISEFLHCYFIPLLCSISFFHNHQMLALRPFLMTAVSSPSEIVVHQAPLGTKKNQIYWSFLQIFLLLFCGCFWNGVFLCRPDLSGLELEDLAWLKLKPRSILFLIMWLCVGIFVWVLMPSEAKERV